MTSASDNTCCITLQTRTEILAAGEDVVLQVDGPGNHIYSAMALSQHVNTLIQGRKKVLWPHSRMPIPKSVLDHLKHLELNELMFPMLMQNMHDKCHKRYLTALKIISPAVLLKDQVNIIRGRAGVWLDHMRAAREQLEPFTRDVLARDDLEVQVPHMGPAAVLRQTKAPPSVDWDGLAQGLRDKLPADLPWTNEAPSGSGGDDPDDLRYDTRARRLGVVLAGGALESLALNRSVNDWDLFLVCGDLNYSNADVRRVIDSVIRVVTKHHVTAENRQHIRVLVSRKESVCNITVVLRKPDTLDHYVQVAKYQIIQRIYASAAHVVAGFDIDSCRLAYDGKTVLAAPTALRAWHNGWNVFDPYTLSKSAVHRYAKKYRAGMGVLLAGVTRNDIHDRLTLISKTSKAAHGNTQPTILNLLYVLADPDASAAPAVTDYDTLDEAGYWDTTISEHVLMHRRYASEINGWDPVPLAVNSNSVRFTGSFHPVEEDIYDTFPYHDANMCADLTVCLL